MAIENLADLFLHTLKATYCAEHRIENALPKLIPKIADGKLRGLFEEQLDETSVQIGRLRRVFGLLDKKAQKKRCQAIIGHISEAEQLMAEIDDPVVRDAALIASAQAFKNYEIVRYSNLCSWADEMGHTNIRDLLKETLLEEMEVDFKLDQLGADNFNYHAMS